MALRLLAPGNNAFAFELPKSVGYSISALLVTKNQLCPRIPQGVGQFVGPTPAIQWNHDGTHRYYGGKSHHPLWVVAHGDGDTIAFVYPVVIDQMIGQLVDAAEILFKTVALIGEGDKGFVGVVPPLGECVT